MERSEVNQRLLDLFDETRYLEIGVEYGTTFHAVRAKRKVAVDPHFKFRIEKQRENYDSTEMQYYEVVSDSYFLEINQGKQKFDVIFIDGLHLFEQTLRDLLNAVTCLDEDGVIVIDDVYPSSYPASLPSVETLFQYNSAVSRDDFAWMGDVYKLVLFIKYYMPLFSYATVLENHGQLIMWRGGRKTRDLRPWTLEAICRAEYIETVVLQKHHFNFLPFAEIETAIRNRRAPMAAP